MGPEGRDGRGGERKGEEGSEGEGKESPPRKILDPPLLFLAICSYHDHRRTTIDYM